MLRRKSTANTGPLMGTRQGKGTSSGSPPSSGTTSTRSAARLRRALETTRTLRRRPSFRSAKEMSPASLTRSRPWPRRARLPAAADEHVRRRTASAAKPRPRRPGPRSGWPRARRAPRCRNLDKIRLWFHSVAGKGPEVSQRGGASATGTERGCVRDVGGRQPGGATPADPAALRTPSGSWSPPGPTAAAGATATTTWMSSGASWRSRPRV